MQILVVIEQKQGTIRKPGLEALSQGRALADRIQGTVTALLIGSGASSQANVLFRYGADAVYVADDASLSVYHPDFYREVILSAIKKSGAQRILMAATAVGQDIAPRVAARLGAGFAGDCIGLGSQGDHFEVDRPLYAGKVIAQWILTTPIQVVTLRPNVFPAVEKETSRNAPIEPIAVPSLSSRLRIKESRQAGSAKIDLTEADVIVTGGRGMKGPEHFTFLEELAAVLGGAVGATRAAVDAGWRPQSDQVGQTGKTVSPNLYMLFGASGSIQHWAGMSGSKCIVAVNKDPAAPIMEKADYSLVGDLFEILPALTEAIRKLRG